MTTRSLKTATGRSLFWCFLALFSSLGLTAQVYQVQGVSMDAPFTIPENTPTFSTVTAEVSGIPSGSAITSITIDLGISTTWVGDLSIFLEAPNGAGVLPIINRPDSTTPGGNGDSSDLDGNPITFDDAATDFFYTVANAQVGGTICPGGGCFYKPGNQQAFANPSGAAGPQLVTFSDYFPAVEDLNGTWTLYLSDNAGGDVSAFQSFSITINGGPPPSCGITNVVPTDPVCGTGFQAGESFIDITFDVVGGSGSYNTFVSEVGETTVFNGGIQNGLPTDGSVTISALINPMGVEPGDVVEVTVVDQNNQSCQGTTFTVTAPLCPPATEGTVTLGCDAMETATVTGSTVTNEVAWYEFVFDGSSDLVSIDTEGSGFDTELGIYDASGTLLASDDDGGPGLLSLLTLGNLPAGTYYVVVGGFNTIFSANFNVSGGSNSGAYVINFNASCNQPPMAVCQPVTIDADANCMATVAAEDFDGGSTDPDGDMLTFSVDPAGPYALGTTNVTLTVSDGTEMSQCMTTVTVEDNTAPDAQCQNVTVQLDANGEGSTTPEAVDNMSTDACGIASLTLDVMDFTCNDVGPNTVILTVEDGNGNSDTCSATVTVEDNTPPSLGPDNFAFVGEYYNGTDHFFNEDYDPADIDFTEMLSQIDANYGAGSPAPGSIDVDNFTLRYLTSFTAPATGSYTFYATTDDGVRLTVDGQEIIEDLTNHPPVEFTGTITLTEGDDIPLVFEFFEGGGGAFLRLEWSSVDAGISRQIFTVPGSCNDLTVQLDENGSGSITPDEVDGGFMDACGIASLTLDVMDFTCDDVGPNTVTLTVEDVNGNSNTCSATVTVEDNVAPDAQCQNVTVQLDVDGNGSTTPEAVDNMSTDACGIASLTLDVMDFTCDDVGPNTVILTVEDVNGNSDTCSATVTVEDNVAPDAQCQDVTVQLDVDGNGSTTPGAVDNMSTDACGIASLTLDVMDFTCDDVGPNTVILTVEDVNGNSDTCSATVTVEDNVAPDAQCQDVTVQLDMDGNGSTTPEAVDNMSTDACGIASLTLDVMDFTCDDVGPNTVILTVEDVNGNSDTCSATVTVEDNIPPVITVTPQTVVLSDADGTATLTVADLATAADACGVESLEASQLLFTCEDIGEVEVIITATDVNGNVSTAPVIVTVEFNQPNLACIGELNVTLDDECGATLIPRMLLTGNVACLDVFDFEIVVQDSDPSNGPVIDGCGTFNYMIRSVGTGIFELDFETCWGVVRAEDKTSPEAETVPDDVELLCVDLDGNNLSTLPASVSKCYRVDGQTGATIPGTMTAALRARLLAGGLTPLVPVFTDGCAQQLEVCVSDAVAFGADPSCDDVVITRTFVATEVSTCVSASGEENAPAVASYTLTFERPTLADLNGNSIEAVVNIESCGSDPSARPAPRNGLGTAQSPNDYPFLQVGDRTFFLENGEAVCNIGVTYSDGPSIVTCPNTYKFVRTYTVIDWCEPSDVRTFTQVVKVGDTTAPTLVGPNVETEADGTLVYGTNAGNICAAFIRLDDITVTDNCPGAVTITAEIFPNGNLNGAPIGAFTVVPGGAPELTPAIPAGTHILRYTYSDVCGNTGVTDYDFRVEDQTPPVAICEDGLNVSIAGGANNGFAVLTPDNIDNGSYDDCSGVTLEIARVNASNLAIGGYGPQITLTCADIGTVRVGLKVTDALGNMNFCWLDVLVEDKIRPTCVAPGNTTITCVDYNASLPNDITDASFAQLDALFGQAAGVDNCGTTITQTVSGTINSCGVGRITRSFTSTDDVGLTNANVCLQVIDVIGIHDYRITFPTDEEGDCMEIPSFDAVVAEELACDLITTTVDVDTLRTQLAGDECFKLRVTYDVVNWCEYNSLGEPYVVRRDAPGALDRTRNPRNIDEDLLYVNVIPGATTATIADDIAFYSLIETDRLFNPAPSPQRDQEYVGYADNANDSRGFFRYTQFIKIYDEVAPEITFTEPAECFAGSGEGCRTTVTLEFTATDECSDATVSVMLDANFTGVFAADNAAALGISVSVANDGEGNYTLTATNVPVGAHAIRVRANDGCGNSDVQIIEFCVTADRTPTPICIQTLTVTLMNDGNGGGIAAIWASDFIASPIVDCFGNVVDKYSLYRSNEAGEAGFTPAVGVLGIDDIDCDDLGDLSVRVYAFDDNGSTPDYCEVIVEVQDNMGWCDGSTGNLSGLIATPNAEVIAGVQVSLTSSAGMDATTTTSAAGTYSFTGLALNADYTVQPVLNASFNAQNVRASDLVAGIGQILGTAPFTSAYQFVAADVNQDGSFDVFDILAGQRAILGLDDGFAGGNWFMVEAGSAISMNNPYAVAFPEVFNANDLQGSVTADFVAVEKMNLTGATGRVAQTLNVDDAQLESGQFRTIILDGSHTAGFQGTIELAAGLELISADLTGQGGLNLNRAGEGLIAVLLREGGSVSLEVRATTSGLVSELITLSDAVTVREGVALNGTSNGLDLAFNADFAPATAQNVLHQNTPNPVREVTVIRFELAAAAPATLTLRDVAGRLVSTQEIDAAAGLNVVELTNIKASGVLTYTLTAGEFTASKKMVVVK